MPYYELKQTTDGQFCFILHAGNNEPILTSERYTTRAAAQSGITTCGGNAMDEQRYRRETSKRGEPYFVLTARNNEIIGTSEMYSSTTARDHGIKAVMNAAPGAPTVDGT